MKLDRRLTIIEKIEIRCDITDTEFKINNNYRADMARLFGMRYPQHAGLFAVRERTSRRSGLPA